MLCFWLSIVGRSIESNVNLCCFIFYFLLLSRWKDCCFKKSCILRQSKMRTGCHCAMKPKGCASKPGQEQQLTRYAHKECLRLDRFTPERAQLSTVILLTCTFTSAATVSSPAHTLNAVLLLFANVCLGSCGTRPEKATRCVCWLYVTGAFCWASKSWSAVLKCVSLQCCITEDTDAYVQVFFTLIRKRACISNKQSSTGR